MNWKGSLPSASSLSEKETVPDAAPTVVADNAIVKRVAPPAATLEAKGVTRENPPGRIRDEGAKVSVPVPVFSMLKVFVTGRP